ncbi:MAG TPA: Rho termination factor N-terminal domain-containing protein [Solirubrobacterales bacterium]|nr:Rho termination factor N-terminal domain-containing protein [Solirubrobacterales bacterium]
MTKAELESKHLAELHSLAAEAGVPRYRMLRREELIEKLLDGVPAVAEKPGAGRQRAGKPERRERPPRPRRERPAKREPAEPRREAPKAAEEKVSPEPEPAAAAGSESSRPRRKRRRRRFGRKSKGVSVHELLLPPPGRQALVYGESRSACTSLLREIAGELAGASEGPDPIALLIDPSPEELADWKREAPRAEIVAAGQARHASDALAQAIRRAEAGEDVILLVDSLTRLDDAEAAKEIFDGGLSQAKGSLTVVAALERSS